MFPIRDHNPSTRVPYITYALIALNVAIWGYGAVFITTDAALGQLYYDYAMIPVRISGGDNLTSLVTSIFLHAGFMHLAGNMLFLFIFGDNIEDKMGHVPFLIFYLACGAGADLAQYVAEPFSAVPTVGASGAIAGIMGGYLLLFPKAKVDILLILIIIFRIVPVPAWLMLGLWFGMQLFGGVGAVAGEGGVAYWAHAGGFIIGVVLIIPLWLRLGGPRFWNRTHGHPDHPPARYSQSTLPQVCRRR